MTEATDHTEIGDALYEKYGRPLEIDHYGEYLAVFPDGNKVLGNDLVDVAEQAKAKFGPGAYLFKVGPKALGKWRGRTRIVSRTSLTAHSP